MTIATRQRTTRVLDALPPYLGGKRKLLGRIARALPSPARAPVLLDAFLGGGAVSLWAKRRGYRVLSNDISERSVIVGRALIANDHVRLGNEDLTRVYATEGPPDVQFVERTFGGEVIPVRHARFLDRLLPESGRLGGTKGALLRLLAIRYVLSLRPMGNFGAKTVVEQMERGAWEDVNSSVLRDCFTSRIQAHPHTLAGVLARRINAGVFANGRTNEIHQGDVFEFLSRVEGDVVYLDPPYAGTQSYETALRPLDSILAGHMVDPTTSAFSGKLGSALLEELLAACRRVPHVVLSYGNAAMTPEAVEDLVRRQRKDVRMEVIEYAHLAAIASAEKKERNVEILIAAGSAE